MMVSPFGRPVSPDPSIPWLTSIFKLIFINKKAVFEDKWQFLKINGSKICKHQFELLKVFEETSRTMKINGRFEKSIT